MRRFDRRMFVAAAVVIAAGAGPAPGARADTAPVAPVRLSTVSADALPTVQVNGVVWSQVIVGDTVYVTGSFTQARPAGAAPGTNQTPRSNILAYTLSTGVLIADWAPTLNAQGLTVAAAPDGSRIYVGGDFTSVSGSPRSRIVALDRATGAVITDFQADAGGEVRVLAATSDTVYAGGTFMSANGTPRGRLAGFSTRTGALTSWAPNADAAVWSMVVPAGSGKVVVGGRFTTMNGDREYGMAAVDQATGATLPWSVNQIVMDAGVDSAITSLTSDGTRVFGTGYVFGDGGNLENGFAADVATGDLVWVSGCKGDNYSSTVVNGVFYDVGHAHDCSAVGAFPQTEPASYQHALAWSATPGTRRQTGTFAGRPAPELLHWLPTLAAGTYTGQSQAAWSIASNSRYVVLGGEFPTVNRVAQQGLTRFAVRSIAPDRQGPQVSTGLTPKLTPSGSKRIRVRWKATWDRDNRRLTYQVLRGSKKKVVATLTADSTWWSRPTMTFTDTSAPAGSQIYRIRVRDALGNQVTSAAVRGRVKG